MLHNTGQNTLHMHFLRMSQLTSQRSLQHAADRRRHIHAKVRRKVAMSVEGCRPQSSQQCTALYHCNQRIYSFATVLRLTWHPTLHVVSTHYIAYLTVAVRALCQSHLCFYHESAMWFSLPAAQFSSTCLSSIFSAFLVGAARFVVGHFTPCILPATGHPKT